MNLTRTSRLIPAALATMAALALTASPALASGHSILRADLVGSMPDGSRRSRASTPVAPVGQRAEQRPGA